MAIKRILLAILVVERSHGSRKVERRDAVRLRRGSCLPGIIGMSAVACESFQRKWYLIVGHPLVDGVRRLSLGGISGIGKISAVVDRLS